MATQMHAVTGQSLATGVGGTPAVTTQARFPGNVYALSGGQFIDNVAGSTETPDVALVDAMFHAVGPTARFVRATSGAGGTNYLGLKKGTTVFTNLVNAVASANAVEDVEVTFHVIHGHSDMADGTDRGTYLQYLQEWRDDFLAEVVSITGQAGMLTVIDQATTWIGYGNGPAVPLAQLDAHRSIDGVVLACPTYAIGDPGSIHKTGIGYHHLGEYHARAAATPSWEPVHPISARLAGRIVSVEFSVPVPPLVLDTDAIAAQVDSGFIFVDDDMSAWVESVHLRPDGVTVDLALNRVPTGDNPQIGYGTAPEVEYGNLRDSETGVSIADGSPLPNWCVQFQDPLDVVQPALVDLAVDEEGGLSGHVIGPDGSVTPVSGHMSGVSPPAPIDSPPGPGDLTVMIDFGDGSTADFTGTVTTPDGDLWTLTGVTSPT